MAVTVLLLTVFASNWVVASPYGLGSEANEGCLCHSPDATTRVSLSGLPTAYESNTSYDVVLSVLSPIETAENASQGGFRLLVSNGTMQVNTTNVKAFDGGWTHTENGSYHRSWSMTWISPEDNASQTNFIVHGNAVNGNNAQTGDAWSTHEITVPGVAFEGDLNPTKGIDGLSTNDTMLLLLVLVLLVGLLWSTGRK
jgi:hypothetical protein